MKSTRRLLSIILCLIMCLSLLPASAFAADDLIASGDANPSDPGKVTFKLYKSGKLVISGFGTVDAMEHWSFSPYYGYTSADDAKKATASETRTLVVEEGITELGTHAFTECANLTSVSLPSSLVIIGYGAFDDDQSLNKITIPGNVKEIGSVAFRDCVNLTSVTLSTGLETIGSEAFLNCAKLASITIPANVKTIDSAAFEACGSLKEITFVGNFDDGSGNGVSIAADAFKGVTATVNYPVDNNSWNVVMDPMSGYHDFGGRLTWKAKTASTSEGGWVKKNGDWYYYVGGKMLVNAWKAYGGSWFYFGADGRMLQGRQQIDGDYYYFGVDGTDKAVGARLSGWHDDQYYGEDGKWQPAYYGVDDTNLDYYKNGWQKVTDSSGEYKWFFIRNKAKVTGWLWSNGYWYYLDPTTGAMVTGWLTVGGKTYYLRPLDVAIADGIKDREGSMVAGRSETIGGTVYTFDDSGALIGGKMEENPLGYENGFRKEGPSWYFYRSDGKKATGWELVNNTWYYFDGNGVMQRGWKQVNGAWYYLTRWVGGTEVFDPTTTDAGKMVTGFQTIPYTKNGVNSTKTYFFTSSGALNGSGWIKVGLKWYYLETDGVVRTGWFRDGSKWYYLLPTSSPIGEMVTGSYTPPTLSDGTANSKVQYFNASGEWTGTTNKYSTAGAWVKHDGVWYYYNADGDDYPTNNNAVTDWLSDNGKWYYLDPSSSPKGKMLTGWQTIGGDKFFFESSGAMLAGKKKIDGVYYYLNPSHDGTYGKLLTGWRTINDEWYYFDTTTGAMQDGWIQRTDGWYYLNEDKSSNLYGAMQHGGWKQLAGKWYYFTNEHLGHYGMLVQGDWVLDGGRYYYMRDSANPAESWMVTGWQKLNWSGGTDWFYFEPASGGTQGMMYSNGTYTIDGTARTFTADGVCTNYP